MSTGADDAEDGDVTGPVEITLTLGESGDLWVARDEETGVASQGETRGEALDDLDEAVALYRGEIYWSTERLIEFAPSPCVSANIYQGLCRPV